MKYAIFWALVLPCLAGCADTTPADIVHETPSEAIYSGAPFQLNARVVNKAGEALAEEPVSISAVPTDVAEVSAGAVRCLKTGDATLTFAGGAKSATATLKCRLVKEVKLVAPGRLVIDTEPSPFAAKAYGQDGEVMPDVEVRVTSSNPSMVQVRGDQLVGKAIGVVTLTAQLGDATATAEVTAIKKLLADNIALSDGESSTRTLETGNYLVEVNTSAKDTSYGVTAKWVGADCAAHPESQQIRTTCRISNAASLVLENPTTFGMGPPAMGNIVIYQLP